MRRESVHAVRTGARTPEPLSARFRSRRTRPTAPYAENRADDHGRASAPRAGGRLQAPTRGAGRAVPGVPRTPGRVSPAAEPQDPQTPEVQP